jgi:hypothetical protein
VIPASRNEESDVNYDKSDVGKGLYPKYTVIRNDGRDKPGEMHEGCEYFVIDLTHDPLAVAPLEAYAEKASEAGYHDLARDLRLKANEIKLRDII